MQSVYVETSIPSYFFETRQTLEARAWRAATRRWWNDYRGSYTLWTSRVVLEELVRAPRHKAGPGAELLRGVPLLDEIGGLAEVAEFYLANKLVPRDALADALHIAFASVHRVDCLLTWNCKHLANLNKARHLAVLNGRLGLPVPVLTTPLTLLPENDHEPEAENPRRPRGE